MNLVVRGAYRGLCNPLLTDLAIEILATGLLDRPVSVTGGPILLPFLDAGQYRAECIAGGRPHAKYVISKDIAERRLID
jgi:hypothetical protein